MPHSKKAKIQKRCQATALQSMPSPLENDERFVERLAALHERMLDADSQAESVDDSIPDDFRGAASRTSNRRASAQSGFDIHDAERLSV